MRPLLLRHLPLDHRDLQDLLGLLDPSQPKMRPPFHHCLPPFHRHLLPSHRCLLAHQRRMGMEGADLHEELALLREMDDVALHLTLASRLHLSQAGMEGAECPPSRVRRSGPWWSTLVMMLAERASQCARHARLVLIRKMASVKSV